ncbi:MAG: twin-arginine translocase subunit TatC [Rikenellaceae bacterium]
MENDKLSATFWDHLDELRGVIIRIAVAVVVVAAAAFSFKDQIFAIIFAPQSSDFVTYTLFEGFSSLFSGGDGSVENFSIEVINTQLTQQFTTHITVSVWVGILLVFPYILFELFRFVSPALYSHERNYAFWVVSWGYVMFLMGVALSYFMVFPLTFRFLATYQVSGNVANLIELNSYIGTLMTLSVMMGLVFELPILCWFFAKLGFISAQLMRSARRYAVIALLVIAALITPTADAVTMLLVAAPMYLLYEASILIVALTTRRPQ